jgi:glutaminase
LKTGHRNRAIAHLLLNFGIIGEEESRFVLILQKN